MNYQEKTVTLKDGTVCRICSPQKKDAGQILEHMRITSEETHHMLRYPDEIMRTREEEEQYLEESLNSETDLLIAAFIGEVFGTSVLGGICAYFVARLFLSNDTAALFSYVLPFFVSTIVGSIIAYLIIKQLRLLKVLVR